MLAVTSTKTNAFVPPIRKRGPIPTAVRSAVVEETAGLNTRMESLTNDLISKLRFREVQRELELRDLETSGTLSVMKNRLREATVSATQVGRAKESHEIDGDALDEVRFWYS